jgi:hypothetical protein
MGYTSWNCARGEAAPVILRCQPTTALAPMDDSVDTNTVVIEGAGTILSFGDCQHYVMKWVKFVPLVLAGMAPGGGGGGASIQLINSPQLNLLSGQQRSINQVSYGQYQCDGSNRWNEVYFVQMGTATALAADVEVMENRLVELERRLRQLES